VAVTEGEGAVSRVRVVVLGLWVGQVVTVLALVAAPALGGFGPRVVTEPGFTGRPL
jgi:hypothetical protein